MVAVCTSLGMHAPLLFPERSGRDYPLTPYLRLLEGFRNDLTVFSGLSHPGVDGAHTAENCFLTAAPHPNRPTFQNSISLDQFAAERLRAETRFRTLSLSTGNHSLSWTRNGVRIPADERPSVVFARLFLDGTPEQVRGQVRRLREGQSIMDTVRGDARRLEAEVGQGDRARLDEYFQFRPRAGATAGQRRRMGEQAQAAT